MLKPQANAQRETMSLDGLWDFAVDADNVGVENGWTQVLPTHHRLAVPGSWNEQIHDLKFYFGVGWYHQRIHVPASFVESGKRVFIHGGGANQDVQVWVNGQEVGSLFGGHLPFEFDITDALNGQREALVVIRIDHRLREMTLPSGTTLRNEDRLGFGVTLPDVPYDFFPYGGVHRSLTVSARAETHLDRLRVETDVDNTTGIVSLKGQLAQAAGSAILRMTCGGEQTEAAFNGTEAMASVRIPDARLWRLGAGELYDCDCEVIIDSTVVDSYRLPVGIRTVKIEGDQLLINGESVYLRGFGKHEDADFSGRAQNMPLLVKDFELLDWIGANSFRTSHYPYGEEWYEEADRRGIAVIGETPFVSLADRLYTPEMSDHSVDVIERMIDRDANHASVIAWSVANEPWHAGSERGLPFLNV